MSATTNRIDARFAALKKDGKRAFVAYICAGDPSLDVTSYLPATPGTRFIFATWPSRQTDVR